MVLREKHKRIPVGFYGYGTRALDALMVHPDFEVKYFWAPEKRLCRDVYEAAERYRDMVHLEIIKNRTDLLNHIQQVDDVTCFVMNASPIILDEPILEQMDFYNIHPGSLTSNRGHHPHLWSILLDEKETEINMHRVTPDIDLGKLISSVTIPVRSDDTSLTLLDRLEDCIGEMLTELSAYLRGEQDAKSVVEEGGYRRNVTYEDYCINQEMDTMEEMDRKIRARAMHSGAFFEQDEVRYYVNRILMQSEAGDEGSDPYIEEKEGILTFRREKMILRFQVSKITDREGIIGWTDANQEDNN